MKQNIDQNKIPTYVTHVTSTLEKAGFEAFLVGGCVRDLILEREPKDWDVTTNAIPEEIIPLFEKTIYENTFGTVGVCIPVSPETLGISPSTLQKEGRGEVNPVTRVTPEYHIIEVTPYRTEANYSDNRHPDEVLFSKHIEDDLKRRDFTINAMAYSFSSQGGSVSDGKGQIIDLYKGQEDLKDKVVRAVGEPDERFKEDGLRMLRAIRFSTQLGFAIDYATMQAVENNSGLIKNISDERIRDEFVKIIESPNSTQGIVLLQKLGLLKHIIPELEEGIGCEQGGAHIYDVFEHLLGALGNATDKGYSTEIRLAALFHDIGKPRSRRPGTKKAYTFYGHEVIGARMTKVIMERLKFPKKSIDLVVSMVRNHMFFSDTEAITLSAVRRIIQKVGKDHIWELMQIRECDRVGMNKKEAPYRLRKYHAMIEECLRDPISVGQLKINGNYLMNEMQIKPGPRMGWILNALLEEVLDNPKKNEIEILKERVGELEKLSDIDLKALGDKAKEKKEELEEQEITQLHKKHGINK